MDDDRALSKADRDVLHAAASGEGLVELTPEMLDELAEASKQTKHWADAMFESMTREDAEMVRRIRVDEGYTWRAVAETCALEWAGDWGSNQLYGMAICERAASFFGDHYMAPPWN